MTMTDRETASEIEAAAARWVIRLDRDGHTAQDIADLEAWLAGDDRRRGAWLAAQAAWLMLDHARDAAGSPPISNNRRSPSLLHRRGVLLAGLGAAAAASVAGGVVLLGQSQRYGTVVGEVRRVPLTDGSTAAINTDSAVEVTMTEAQRTVRIARGEAWFQVARNPQRPFVVAAGVVRVRAVGTAFAVRLRPGGADVLVTEGVVETWIDGAENSRVRLQAGSRAFVSDDVPVEETQVVSAELDRLLAWRAGKLDLAGETLATAAGEFNRYNARKIEVAPALADAQFFGVFRTDDPEGFARAVQASLGVPVSIGAHPAVIRIGDGDG